MAIKTKTWKLVAKIKQGLDGRSQRWLSEKINISEVMLSNKMTGIIDFTTEEIEKIEQVLNIKLK